MSCDEFCSFFGEADDNKDKFIAEEELENLMSELFKTGKTKIKQDDAIKSVLSKLDYDKDKKITEKEFIEGFVQWINEAKNNASSSDINPSEMYQKVN